MRSELEPQDIEAIARKVVEMLLPLIPSARQEDEVFDKQGLADYLKVDISWINKQIANRAIPYFHLGKYVRFKKSRIDRWVETKNVEPSSPVRLIRR